ncbi:MAG TPA: tetratricopeptide repeat protein [Firmicutes bacterium]|jgi:tetratricopeptide (TPR) repeat protein|nr:MAG: hypothetical protein AA931_03690 [Peptococcaceae bacterium 1109]HHT74341.1 tetratricopeptide repeat protein [Bacillota bacterium]
MWKRRCTLIALVLLISLSVFFKAAGQSQYIQNGMQALVYHAMQIERFFPELDPVGAAIGEFEKAIQAGDGDEAHLLLGLVYQNMGLDQQAAAEFQRFLRRNPEDGWAWALVGDSYLRLGEYSLAQQAYAKSKEYGSFARSHFGLGSIFLDAQDYTAAREAFELALEEAPDFLGARVGLGISLYHLEEYEEAVEVLELTQLLDPRSVEIHHYLALTYDALGRTEQAEHTRERITQLTP